MPSTRFALPPMLRTRRVMLWRRRILGNSRSVPPPPPRLPEALRRAQGAAGGGSARAGDKTRNAHEGYLWVLKASTHTIYPDAFYAAILGSRRRSKSQQLVSDPCPF